MAVRDERPLLVRLARRQARTKGRSSRYDEDQDMLLVATEGGWMPAIDAAGPAPETKKADLEKGEDRKDRWR